MSECNRCTLNRMERRARARGVEVVVRVETAGDMAGWTSARYSDADEPSAYFMVLSDDCAC